MKEKMRKYRSRSAKTATACRRLIGHCLWPVGRSPRPGLGLAWGWSGATYLAKNATYLAKVNLLSEKCRNWEFRPGRPKFPVCVRPLAVIVAEK